MLLHLGIEVKASILFQVGIEKDRHREGRRAFCSPTNSLYGLSITTMAGRQGVFSDNKSIRT